MTRVLIVDDEPLMRKDLLTLLDWAALDCQVVEAVENGRQAVQSIEKHRPHLVISDIRMPVMDGLVLAKYLHEQHPQIRLILLTAYADFDYAKQAIRYGVSDYVTKIGSLEEITAAVERCQAAMKTFPQKNSVREQTNRLLKTVLVHGEDGYGVLESQNAEPDILFSSYTVTLLRFGIGETVLEKWQDDVEARLERLFAHELPTSPRHWVWVSPNCAALLWSNTSPHTLTQLCADVQVVFAEMTGVSFCVGISAQHQSVFELHSAYQEGLAALADCFYGHTCVSVFTKKESSGYNNIPIFDKLEGSLRTGRQTECADILHGLLTTQKQASAPLDTVWDDMNELFRACRKAVLRLDADGKNRIQDDGEWQKQVRGALFHADCGLLAEALITDCCRLITSVLLESSTVTADALAYIDAHFREPLTLGEIAAAVYVHPNYLSRCFKQKTGKTVVVTLTQKRMEYTKALLEQGNLKIFEVALEIGFEDTSYFSHVFRKYTGVSAKAYQERFRKQKS